MKLTQAEAATLKRKSYASLPLSCDLKSDVLRRELAAYIQDIIRTLTTKRLKSAQLILVETEDK